MGRLSRNVESYREQAQASAADLAVVNLSMHSDLAVDYFAARSLDAEEKLLRDTVAQYEQALNLNEDRYQGGLASEVDVQQARTILETTRAQMVDTGVARAQYEHAVAVLIGKPPAGVSLHRVAVDEHPDLYVYYHMVTQEVMDSTTTDDGFGWGGGRWGRWGGWGGWGGPDIAQTAARPRMMGILAIDLCDVKKKQMVWRGQATEDSISNSQKGDEKQVQKSLEKMFKQYPPKEK